MKLLHEMNGRLEELGVPFTMRVMYGLGDKPNTGFVVFDDGTHQVPLAELDADAEDLHTAVAEALAALSKALHPASALEDDLSVWNAQLRRQTRELGEKLTAALDRESAVKDD